MTRVNMPLGSLEASGTINQSLVYGAWKGQQWVRAWRSPGNPQTARQQTWRANMANAVHDWRLLLDEDRARWDEWAGLNPHIDPTTGLASPWSGFNAYVSLYLTWSLAEIPVITGPRPYPPTYYRSWWYPAILATPVITGGPTFFPFKIDWQYSSAPQPGYGSMMIYGAPRLSNGVKPSFKKASWLETVSKPISVSADIYRAPGTYDFWLRLLWTDLNYLAPTAPMGPFTVIVPDLPSP